MPLIGTIPPPGFLSTVHWHITTAHEAEIAQHMSRAGGWQAESRLQIGYTMCLTVNNMRAFMFLVGGLPTVHRATIIPLELP